MKEKQENKDKNIEVQYFELTNKDILELLKLPIQSKSLEERLIHDFGKNKRHPNSNKKTSKNKKNKINRNKKSKRKF